MPHLLVIVVAAYSVIIFAIKLTNFFKSFIRTINPGKVIASTVTPYIDGSRAVFCINCSLVTPVSRQRQSDGY